MPPVTKITPVDGYLDGIPSPEEIERQIAENMLIKLDRHRQLLRQLLKLSEQRQNVKDAGEK